MQRILILRVALLLSGVWLLPILLIRAQPYDASEVRHALSPPADCAAPCFMGIQPSVTTVREVVDILKHQPWVEPGSYDDPSNVIYNVMAWQWSDAAPAWIDRGHSSVVSLSPGRVGVIVVETNIPWGDFVLAFGMPDEYHLVPTYQTLSAYADSEYQHEGWYADWGMLVYAGGTCWTNSTLYDWPVVLYFRAESPGFAAVAYPFVTQCR